VSFDLLEAAEADYAPPSESVAALAAALARAQAVRQNNDVISFVADRSSE
jgi:hypothetical protein